MKLRILMLFTLVLAAVLFLLPLLGNRFYRPEYAGLPYDRDEDDFELYADDATLLRGTVTRPEGSPPADGFTVVLLADTHLDRDWTAGGRGFPVGKILARHLAGRGHTVVRYDQRGTGATIQSGRNYASPLTLARDLRRLLEQLPGVDRQRPRVLLAQGDGCAVALQAFNRFQVSAARLILAGCSLRGNLLEQWLGRILANMRRAGVAPDILEQARQRIQVWRRARPFAEEPGPGRETPDREGMHPDLQALERALEEMASERLVRFTREAEAFDFPEQLRAALNGRDTRVTHLIGERDRVILPEAAEAARQAADELERLYAGRYRLRLLADTDHFLAEREDDPAGALPFLIANLSPLRRIAPEVLATLADVLSGAQDRPGRAP